MKNKMTASENKDDTVSVSKCHNFNEEKCHFYQLSQTSSDFNWHNLIFDGSLTSDKLFVFNDYHHTFYYDFLMLNFA